MNTDRNIVIFSPVRIQADVFNLTLSTWINLEYSRGELGYWIYDDGDDNETSGLIAELPNVRILERIVLDNQAYQRPYWTHEWNSALVNRLIRIKNAALSEFLDSDYDMMLLIDSDICVHPSMLNHLASLDVDIVSEVFWTRFRPLEPFMPNAWDYGDRKYYTAESVIRYRTPNQYNVGGLGACTLVSKNAVRKGVSFSRITGVDHWGEDIHFCIRASCLDLPLHLDTCFPAFHVYRTDMVSEAKSWLNNGCQPGYFTEKYLDSAWEEEMRFYVRDKWPENNLVFTFRKKIRRALTALQRKEIGNLVKYKFIRS